MSSSSVQDSPVKVVHESDTVARITLKDKEILLLGTAHVSHESVEQVSAVIREEKPDQVCVEIDAGRYQSISKKENWEQMNLNKVFREKKGFLLLANLVMAAFQRKVGLNTGIKPGEEMKRAIEVAKELEIPFSFSDRPVQITLQRAWSKSNFWNKMKLLASLISSVFTKEEVDSKEVEALKQKGALEDMMGELADYLPSVKSVLIDERDQYLATNIYRSKGKRVLAVVGAGHMAGMIRWISDLAENKVDDDLREISSLPPRKISSRIIPWIIPAFVAGIITYGFIKSGPELGLQMVTTWVLLNGILASIGSIAALAHPLTIIGAFLAAPITSTNPIVGVGMVTGIMEYFLRKPQVRDMESLQDDLTTFKGWYKNRISRILLVFFFSSLGSIVGTFAAIIKNLLLAR